MNNKRILLAISGGIAAYKCAELVRQFIKQGAEVRVVMTEAAREFISPLTLQALSGSPVRIALFDRQQEYAMGHIELARWAEFIVIAPATANIIAKLSNGLADDLLTTIFLAAECPVYLAPAMNRAMWHKPVTQQNIQRLKQQGVRVLGPEAGEQACGEVGEGRMIEPDQLCLEVLRQLNKRSLQGKKVLLTAGPTIEAIDPVRYLTNRSSGKMGYALASAAIRAGAEVSLVSGPVALTAPHQAKLTKIQSADEMYQAVMAQIGHQDIFIAAAAVADYRLNTVSPEKIKKHDDELILTLTKTRDILGAVAALPNAPFTVGFAAETVELEKYALDKLARKGIDMIAANWVGRAEGGFEADRNALEIFWKDGRHSFAMMPKMELAEHLIELIATRISEN